MSNGSPPRAPNLTQMDAPLVFTHIPKTAGTSLKKSVIAPNVTPEQVYWVLGVGKLIRDRPRNADVILGHIPYGIHRVLPHDRVRYLTILRDPVDRCVSFYNYVLMCETGTPGHRQGVSGHPALADAKRHSIDEFYALEPYRNIQTKFTAGLLWDRARNALPASVREIVASERRMLETAQHNLAHEYWLFGLLDQIEDTENRIARALGWAREGVRDTSRQTKGWAGQVNPSESQRERIRELNALDVELYAFAAERYDAQTVGTP